MLIEAVLTVAESKRLIAKGVAAHPLVREALVTGTVIVARGGTNSYVAEELLGQPMDRLAFLTGHTLPRERPPVEQRELMPEIVIRKREWVKGVTLAQALASLGRGDVFIKGANALSSDRRTAGILIGSPSGGTIGAALPVITERKAHLVVPVGLEKLVASDIRQVSEVIAGAMTGSPRDAAPTQPRLRPAAMQGPGRLHALWVIDTAIVITEIEAVELLTGATCHHLASGGIGGAEGSVRLLVSGSGETVDKARELLDSIAGEPAFPV